MKNLFAIVALTAWVGAAPLAFAQVEPQQRDFLIDDDEDKQIREIESALAEILVLDESGQVVMREEMAEVLPEGVPLERINMMLGTFVEVDDDGKFKLTESARPYLPMLKNFLRPEMLERLRKLRSLSPEERKAELEKLMEEQQQEGGGFGMRPEGRGPAPSREPKAKPEPRRATPKATRAPRDANRDEGDRIDRIERRLERIEELLERSLEGRGAPRARRERRGLGRLFGNRDGERRGLDLGKGLRRARTLANGMRRLSDIATPEDMDLLRRMMADSGLTLQDLRDRDELLSKMQGSLEPQDMGRMMEVFSEFMGTDEGRDFVDELDGMAEDFEGMMNGDGGERMGKLMERLEGMLGNGEGKGLEALRKLTQGRDRDRKPEARKEEHHRSAPKRLHKDSDRSNPAPRRSRGSRLY